MSESLKIHSDFVLHAAIYDCQVGVFIDFERFKEWHVERKLPLTITKENTNGFAKCVCDSEKRDWFVMYVPLVVQDHTLVHETLHSAWHILDSRGVKVTAGNHEALAYLQQHLYEQLRIEILRFNNGASTDGH